MWSISFLALYGRDLEKLEYGLSMWDLVEFHENGLEYNTSGPYFKQYKKYYTDVVPRALYGFINALTNKGGVNIWTAGYGKYCKYKEYFDHLLSMSKIRRCEIVYYRNGICSNKDLGIFLENKKKIKDLYEKHCWGKICRHSKYSRGRNKHSPTFVDFLTFFHGIHFY